MLVALLRLHPLHVLEVICIKEAATDWQLVIIHKLEQLS